MPYFFKNYADIIIKKNQVTVEICSQGGINAVNGFNDFKVLPVQIVSNIPNMRRENGNSKRQRLSAPKAESFKTVLESVADENQPGDCYTVTYNANSQLQTFFYRLNREYKF